MLSYEGSILISQGRTSEKVEVRTDDNIPVPFGLKKTTARLTQMLTRHSSRWGGGGTSEGLRLENAPRTLYQGRESSQ